VEDRRQSLTCISTGKITRIIIDTVTSITSRTTVAYTSSTAMAAVTADGGVIADDARRSENFTANFTATGAERAPNRTLRSS
jgi:hypothetical protein